MRVCINSKLEWDICDKEFCDEDDNRWVGFSAESLASFLDSKHAVLWVDKAHPKCQTNKLGNVVILNVQ